VIQEFKEDYGYCNSEDARSVVVRGKGFIPIPNNRLVVPFGGLFVATVVFFVFEHVFSL
jgi:hypothetical protein